MRGGKHQGLQKSDAEFLRWGAREKIDLEIRDILARPFIRSGPGVEVKAGKDVEEQRPRKDQGRQKR